MSTFSKMVAGSLVVAALGASSAAGAGASVVNQFDTREMAAILGIDDVCGSTEIVIFGFDNVSHLNGGPPQAFKEVLLEFFSFNSCDDTSISGSGFVDLPGANVQIASNGNQGSLSGSFPVVLQASDGTTTTVQASVTLAMTANGIPAITTTHQRGPDFHLNAHETTFQVPAIPTGSVTLGSQSFSLAPASAFVFLTSGKSGSKP